MVHVIGFPTFKLYITQTMRDEQTAILKEEEVAQAKKAAAVASLSRVLAVHRAVLRAASITSWTARNAGHDMEDLDDAFRIWLSYGWFVSFRLHVLSKWICHACLYQTMTNDHPTSADVSPICFTYWYAHEFVNVGCIDSIPSYYTYIYNIHSYPL